MTLMEIIDEKDRWNGFKVDPNGKEPISQTHTFSYLCARDLIKNYEGEKIGIEAPDFYERNKEAIVMKILKHYGLSVVKDTYEDK